MGGRLGYIGWGRKGRGGGQRVFREMTALKDESRGIFSFQTKSHRCSAVAEVAYHIALVLSSAQ